MPDKEPKLCFEEYDKHCIKCPKKECKFWIKSPKDKNCTIIAARQGPMTLQEIGDIFGVTRMRICQIEKTIFKKLKNLNVLNQI